jgi:large subunit ribosomal protein L23
VNEKRIYEIILGPVTSEKSVRVADRHRQIVFKVARNATKNLVKQAVQKLFSVQVTNVQTVTTKGKRKQFKQREGRRSDHKKAYVSLAEGHDINLANFQ